jgi:hypothetical protein
MSKQTITKEQINILKRNFGNIDMDTLDPNSKRVFWQSWAYICHEKTIHVDSLAVENIAKAHRFMKVPMLRLLETMSTDSIEHLLMNGQPYETAEEMLADVRETFKKQKIVVNLTSK